MYRKRFFKYAMENRSLIEYIRYTFCRCWKYSDIIGYIVGRFSSYSNINVSIFDQIKSNV